MTRPFSVTLVAGLVLVSGAFDLVFGVWMMLAPIGGAPTITDVAGNTQQISSFFLVINGLLSAVLGLMYFWLARQTMIGSATAFALINLLAMINIFFGLFRLPFGWGVILLSALAIILVNTTSSKAWFTQTR